MKTILLAVVLQSSVAHAQVIECPARFPAKEVTLPASPSDPGAAARVTTARLSGAYFIEGQIYGPRVFIPETETVPGGLDIKFGFLPNQPRWLVCKYGGTRWGSGEIERWTRIPGRMNNCDMKVREIKVPHTTSDWSVTTTCSSAPAARR